MGVPMSHLFRQGPVIGTLVRTAASAAVGAGTGGDGLRMSMPGPTLERAIQPRNARLVSDYIRHTGGEGSWYKGVLPPHFFPQWGFPLLAKTLQGLPYNMSRVLNGGCRIEMLHPLPMGEPLLIKARLVDVDDNGNRVVFKQKLVTGTVDHPESLISYVNAILPLKGSGGSKREKPRVPAAAREIDQWKLAKRSGLDFALLTGDFNPVHWISAYARMFGFPGTILHGFATMARSIESLNRTLWMGRPQRLRSFDSRFVKPLAYPGRVKVYVDDECGIYVGEAPGGPAYLTGSYTLCKEKDDE